MTDATRIPTTEDTASENPYAVAAQESHEANKHAVAAIAYAELTPQMRREVQSLRHALAMAEGALCRAADEVEGLKRRLSMADGEMAYQATCRDLLGDLEEADAEESEEQPALAAL